MRSSRLYYNGNGDVSAYTNPLNQTINYTFDDADRETGIDYPTGTNTSFGYDNANRPTSMTDATGTTTWTLDNASQLTALSTPEGNMSYTYQDSGRRATMVEAGVGTTTYGYDSDGRLTSLQNPFNETTTFSYDDVGRLTQKTLANGAYTAYGYDDRNRTTSVTHKKSDGTVISSETYVLDGAGNMTSKTVDGTETDYTYDHINQLLTESRTGYSATYTYDANSNRTSKTLNGVTDTYNVDNADKLTSITEGATTIESFGYDSAGRTTSISTSAGTTTLAYDYEDRITSITNPDLSTNMFAYNGLDARTSKIDSTGTYTYKRDGAEVTDPVLSDGAANYTPSISESRSGTSKFVLADQLGSMTALTDSVQTVTDNREYDAFGNLLSLAGSTPTPFDFAESEGYQADGDCGLTLVGHRYYDSSTGRFLTRDPTGDGRNWFNYADSNPISNTDPDGLSDGQKDPGAGWEAGVDQGPPDCGKWNARWGGFKWPGEIDKRWADPNVYTGHTWRRVTGTGRWNLHADEMIIYLTKKGHGHVIGVGKSPADPPGYIDLLDASIGFYRGRGKHRKWVPPRAGTRHIHKIGLPPSGYDGIPTVWEMVR